MHCSHVAYTHAPLSIETACDSTGKTLSIICALVTWLQHAYDAERMPAGAITRSSDAQDGEPDWLCESDENQEADAPVGTQSASDAPPKVQVIYASRTHSQLSQFLGVLALSPLIVYSYYMCDIEIVSSFSVWCLHSTHHRVSTLSTRTLL